MNDRFKFRYVFEKDFGGKTGICYKMPVFNLDDAVRSVFENKIIEYTNFDYKLIAKNQCTGLKDKYGKLIYEGDVVKVNDKVTAVIEFYRGIFGCRFDRQYKNFERFLGVGAYSDFEIEVIGNIYENKELIDEHKK